jgi:hypothetical protein
MAYTVAVQAEDDTVGPDYEAESRSPRQSAEEPEEAVENWDLVRSAPFQLEQLQAAARNS